MRQLTQLQGGFATGQQTARYLELPGLPPASPLICYESIFPDEVVTRGRRPAFFLNVTNDGWFGRTAGPHQHFHQARVRAVEQGLPLVRVANTGISGVIDGRGRILERAGLNQEAVIDTALPSSLAPTLYSRFGELLLVLVLAGGTCWLDCFSCAKIDKRVRTLQIAALDQRLLNKSVDDVFAQLEKYRQARNRLISSGTL